MKWCDIEVRRVAAESAVHADRTNARTQTPATLKPMQNEITLIGTFRIRLVVIYIWFLSTFNSNHTKFHKLLRTYCSICDGWLQMVVFRFILNPHTRTHTLAGVVRLRRLHTPNTCTQTQRPNAKSIESSITIGMRESVQKCVHVFVLVWHFLHRHRRIHIAASVCLCIGGLSCVSMRIHVWQTANEITSSSMLWNTILFNWTKLDHFFAIFWLKWFARRGDRWDSRY